MTTGPNATSVALAQAREWAASGDPRAERGFHRVLELDPDCVEARAMLARAAMARGAMHEALLHWQQACTRQPDNPHLLKSMAIAADACGYPEEARQALEYAVTLAPNLYHAHLVLGSLLERAGDRRAATRAYFRAITRAQFDGHWLDLETTPPRLRESVRHAVAYVQTGRIDVIAGLLEPLHDRFGRDAMRRVERCLLGYLGIESVAPADSRQKPKFLFFPDIPSTPFHSTTDFEWIERLEQAFSETRNEARGVLEQSALTPFLDLGPDDSHAEYLQGGDLPPRWDAFFFYRHGQPYSDNLRRCPATASVLQSLPLLRIAEHAPEVCFSVLSPGTHILPHHGVTNVRAVVHLPLLVPSDCALQVAGQTHEWQEGRCVAFDDTYLHEAWNRSGQTRVILLMDAWNPHLTLPEREAMTSLIEGIGEFNRG